VCSGNTEEQGVRLRAHGFILLIRKLSQSDLKAIEFAINTFATSHTKFIAQQSKAALRSAFEKLSNALPAVKEQIAFLEQLPENEREELSNERMKKLLASLKGNN
jgi:hypothetical protein